PYLNKLPIIYKLILLYTIKGRLAGLALYKIQDNAGGVQEGYKEILGKTGKLENPGKASDSIYATGERFYSFKFLVFAFPPQEGTYSGYTASPDIVLHKYNIDVVFVFINYN
ncbi:hypothetical protein ACJX0J_034131, partial [Zea mays]